MGDDGGYIVTIKELLERFKWPLALSLVGVVLILGGLFSSHESKPQAYPQESVVTPKIITVDVSGAVKQPGVYKLTEGARIEEAITAAGGFDNDADSIFVSKDLNLAQKITDGSKIYIPRQGEQVSGVTQVVGAVNASNIGKISINSASQSELESLSGIGPVTASKIISNRPYNNLQELVDEKIVPSKTFDKIKDQLSI